MHYYSRFGRFFYEHKKDIKRNVFVHFNKPYIGVCPGGGGVLLKYIGQGHIGHYICNFLPVGISWCACFGEEYREPWPFKRTCA